uniref:KH domain-containing protein akap-1 n=1 Tax=Cacopsylla melanoneura TaxID=428564 RepID=A0A8D8UUK9_9HEMI
MVRPGLGLGLGSAGPTHSIVKWTLPISLLVTVLGFWWHNVRKKRKPRDGTSDTDSVRASAEQTSSLVKANGVGPADAASYPDLNAFIETVIKLNAGTLETNNKEPLANGGPHVGNGCVAVPSPRAKRSAPQATPKQNSSPWSEQQVVARSAKYLDSETSVLDSLEFGVAKIDDSKQQQQQKEKEGPVAKKKLWSELVEEDSENEVLVTSSCSNILQEELQFPLEEHCTVVRSSCDSTTPTLDRTRSSSDYHNTKSYSESEANAEVSNIISTETTTSTQQRDSANHSPAAIDTDTTTMPVTASPSLSDVHSEGSSDSGKGCSESSRTPAGGSSVSGEPPSPAWTEYHFVLPQPIVGRLIGKNGSFIHRVRTLSHTKIYIKRHPASHKLKLCALEGAQADIDHALSLIRQKFPLSQYPFLTMEKVPFISADTISCALRPEPFHLQLVEGINNDVCISSLVSAGHFFVQLPSHPSHASLTSLNLLMNTTYSSSQAPLLPAPVENALVAAPAMGGWFRAQILAVDPVTASCTVKFVDYGGYLSLETAALRQIRADFLSLPFQAIECGLANIVPNNNTSNNSTEGESGLTVESETPVSSSCSTEWSEEARGLVHGLTSGHILQAQVYDYDQNTGVPMVYLYTLRDSEVVLVNQELVERGYAKLHEEAASLVSSTETKVSPSTTTSSGISSPSSEQSTTPESDTTPILATVNETTPLTAAST